MSIRPWDVNGDGYNLSSFTKRKPSGYTCVAVKFTDESVFVRDTKDPEKITLTFNHSEWKAFIDGVKKGEFDLT